MEANEKANVRRRRWWWWWWWWLKIMPCRAPAGSPRSPSVLINRDGAVVWKESWPLIHCQPAVICFHQYSLTVELDSSLARTSARACASSSLTCPIPAWLWSAVSSLPRWSPRSRGCRGCRDTNGSWHPGSCTNSPSRLVSTPVWRVETL